MRKVRRYIKWAVLPVALITGGCFSNDYNLISTLEADLPFSRKAHFIIDNAKLAGEIKLERKRSKTYVASVFAFQDFEITFDSLNDSLYIFSLHDRNRFVNFRGNENIGNYQYGLMQVEGDVIHLYRFPNVDFFTQESCDRTTNKYSATGGTYSENPFSGLVSERLGQDIERVGGSKLYCGLWVDGKYGRPTAYRSFISSITRYVYEQDLRPSHSTWLASLRRT